MQGIEKISRHSHAYIENQVTSVWHGLSLKDNIYIFSILSNLVAPSENPLAPLVLPPQVQSHGSWIYLHNRYISWLV